MDTVISSPFSSGTLTFRIDAEAILVAALIGVALSLCTHYLFYGRLRALYREFAVVAGLFCMMVGWGANGLLAVLQEISGVPGADQHWSSYIFWACLGLGIALGMMLGYDLHMALFHGRQIRLGGRVIVRLPDWRKDNDHGYR